MMNCDKILLDHGSGGKATQELIKKAFLPRFDNPILSRFDDSAVINLNGTRFAFSTDSYTVDPIFFPGGDIGELAINGTVNDIAMAGAKPLYISVALIIEEGFSVENLETILESMKRSAKGAGVQVVTGDTKVVHRNAADKIFINTSGVGHIPNGVILSGNNAQPGDKIILSGTIADHGMTILTQREGLTFESSLCSDTAPLNHMVADMIAISDQVHTLRDPTRGGVATTLNEIALQSNVGLKLYENEIPIREETRGVCELLGMDPLYVANEGKLLACVSSEDVSKLLKVIRSNRYGTNAAVIGEVTSDSRGKVLLETAIGGTRIINMLNGDQLPRIC
jgi:hydrogenase expression/formation protein HypE